MAIFERKKTKKASTESAGEAPKKAPKTKSESTVVASSLYAVVVKPLVTEKAATMASANKYGFVVASHATKQSIKHAVESMYKVTVKNVNVVNVQGRVVRFGRNAGKRSDYKKAIVTLEKGQSIAVHEGV